MMMPARPALPLPLLRLLALLATLVLAALPARAADDPLPAFAHTTVNDFAGILTPADTQTLDEALIALKQQTGAEGTVVTLPDRSRYGSDSLEAFARRLFDSWGVGQAQRNDGFMILVVPSAREMRIELGAGYGRDFNVAADDVVGRVMLPAFRAGRLSDGVRDGTLAVIDRIARPQAARQPPGAGLEAQGSGGGGLMDRLLPLAVFGVFGVTGFGMLRSLFRRRQAARCPQCGGAVIAQDEMQPNPLPGGIAAGQRLQTRRCPACGWSAQQIVPMPVVWGNHPRDQRGIRSRRDIGGGGGGGFGGGRSGGGGASGRW